VEGIEQLADAFPCVFDGSFVGFAQKRFELGEGLLDWVEIRTVGRQEEELGADGADGFAHGTAFVAAEIVHDDDVAGGERRRQDLLDIGEEALAVDRSIDDAGCIDPVGAQCGEERQRPPAAPRDFRNQPLAARTAAMGTRHIGFGPGLVDEDQTGSIELALMRFPAKTPPGDVRPVLLGCVQAFF
jgi:hypothetical protein